MKQERWCGEFIVIYNNGKVVKFEPTAGADIYDCVKDIISFLRKHNVEGEFVLKFNDKKLNISKSSFVKEVVNQYFGRDKQDGMGL